MGAEHDEEPGVYVANGARRFAARASDEDWLGLMNAIERASDPGRAVLEKIVLGPSTRIQPPRTARMRAAPVEAAEGAMTT